MTRPCYLAAPTFFSLASVHGIRNAKGGRFGLHSFIDLLPSARAFYYIIKCWWYLFNICSLYFIEKICVRKINLALSRCSILLNFPLICYYTFQIHWIVSFKHMPCVYCTTPCCIFENMVCQRGHAACLHGSRAEGSTVCDISNAKGGVQ